MCPTLDSPDRALREANWWWPQRRRVEFRGVFVAKLARRAMLPLGGQRRETRDA